MANERILARNEYRSNDTWITGINNNDLIIGPSGAGKTRNYVKPNLMQLNESFIVADTKGNLYSELERMLSKNGYKVIKLDFRDVQHADGFNPLDFIDYDPVTKRYSQLDALKIAAAMVPLSNDSEPFWDYSARTYLNCLIAGVMEGRMNKTMSEVIRLFNIMDTPAFDAFYKEINSKNNHSYAFSCYQSIKRGAESDKNHATTLMILNTALQGIRMDNVTACFDCKNRIDFNTFSKEKTALFFVVSDTDRSIDCLYNIFYMQAIQALVDLADKSKGSRLAIPVRFIFDDFATNTVIEDFDKIISVIRSREIYFSIILQSITQLDGIYGSHRSTTILNNCDNLLYLGGQDLSTARYISEKANKDVNEILNMSLKDVFLFTRGEGGKSVQKYDIREHPLYYQLPESAKTPPIKPTPQRPARSSASTGETLEERQARREQARAKREAGSVREPRPMRERPSSDSSEGLALRSEVSENLEKKNLILPQ